MRATIASRFAAIAGMLSIVGLAACSNPEERARAHYDKGAALLAENDPVKAGLEFRNAIKLNEGHVPAWFSLGLIAERQAEFDNAVGIFTNVAERDAGHVEARVHLARIFFGAGETETALKFADQAYALDPGDAEVLAIKAAVAFRMGRPDEAVDFAERALSADPGNIEATVVRAAQELSRSDPKAALAILERSGEEGDRNIGLQLFRIKTLTAAGDKKGIEEVFEKLIAYYPDDASLRTGFAVWYLREGRPQDAEGVLRQAAKSRQGDKKAAFDLVSFVARERGADAARLELEALIAAGGDVFEYRMRHSELVFSERNQAGALQEMKKLVEESEGPQAVTAKVQLVRMLVASGDRGSAATLIDEVIESDTSNVDALKVRASLRLLERKTPEAITDLVAASNEAPRAADLKMLLAEAYEKNGAAALAEEQFVSAMTISGYAPDAAVVYAEFLLRYGKREQADRVLTQARGNAPKHIGVARFLADLRVAAKDWAGVQEITASLKALDAPGAKEQADLISASSLGRQGKYDDSIAILKPIATDLRHPAAVSLVQTYVAAGRFEEAFALLDQLDKARPGSTEVAALRGSAQEAAGKLQEAEAAYRAAAANGSGHEGSAHKALVDFLLRHDRVPEAETAASEALATNPDDWTHQFQMALVLKAAGKIPEAIALYEKLHDRDPQSTAVANNYSSLLSEYSADQNALDRAFQVAGRFRNAEVPQFKDTLGWIYYRRGEFDRAVPLLQEAAEKLPDLASVQYHLGLTYQKLGNVALAIEKLNKAVARSEDLNEEQRSTARSELNELLASRTTTTQ